MSMLRRLGALSLVLTSVLGILTLGTFSPASAEAAATQTYYLHGDGVLAPHAEGLVAGTDQSFSPDAPQGDKTFYGVDTPFLVGAPVFDPIWSGQIDGIVSSLKVDVWVGNSAGRAYYNGEYVQPVLTVGATEFDLGCALLRRPLTQVGPTLLSATFTQYRDGGWKPLQLDPAGRQVSIAIRSCQISPSVVYYGSKEFPSSFTVNPPGDTASPTPTVPPTPTATPTPVATTPTEVSRAAQTRYYFHDAETPLGAVDHTNNLKGGRPPFFDADPPKGQIPALWHDTPGLTNAGKRGLYDPVWVGKVDGLIETLEVDFWQKTSQETGLEDITYVIELYVEAPGRYELYRFPVLSVPSAGPEVPFRVTHTFTKMFDAQGRLVPLRIDPGTADVSIDISDRDLIPDASVIVYDSVDYPSGFTVNVPPPAVDPDPEPTVTPSPSPSQSSAEDYIEPVWFEWDTTTLDVLILPPGHGQVVNEDGVLGGEDETDELSVFENSYVRATEDSIQAWREAVQTFGSDRLKQGLSLNSYVVGRDEIPSQALEDPEVVITTGEENPYYLGVAASTRPCLIQNNKFFYGTSFSYADMYSINAQEFGHCLGLEHVYTGAEDNDAPDEHPVLDYDALRAYYPFALGSNATPLQCVSNLNVAGLELVFGEVLGGVGGEEARVSPADYRRMPCNGSTGPSPTPSASPASSAVTITDRSATSGQFSDQVDLEAVLTDSTGDPITGGELVFELNGEGWSTTERATTDASGTAVVSPYLAGEAGGYEVSVTFGGSADHLSSVARGSFEVLREELSLTAQRGVGRDRWVVRAVLHDNDQTGGPVIGRTIYLLAGDSTISSGVTDDLGETTIEIPPRYRTQPDYVVSFEGDRFFAEVSTGV